MINTIQKDEVTTPVQAVRNFRNGMLVLDGKGQLPHEVSKLLDLVIDKDTCKNFNYFEGQKPEVFAKVILNIFGGTAKDPTWMNAGYSMLYYGFVFHQALIKHCGAKKSPMAHIRTIMSMAENVDADGNHPILVQFANVPELMQPGTILNDALNKFLLFSKLADETKSSVVFTVENWMLKFIQSEDLRPWADCEYSDFNFEDILMGAKIGISLPEYQYGEAGLAIQSLMKARLYNEIKNRGNESLERGFSRVFLFVDECQRFLDEMDLAILPEARSLELVCTFSTQNNDSVYEKYQRDGGEKFLASFASNISFKSTPATYLFIQERIKKGKIIVKKFEASIIDFETNAKLQMGTPYFDQDNPHRTTLKAITFSPFGGISKFFKKNPVGRKLWNSTFASRFWGFGRTELMSHKATLDLSKDDEYIFNNADMQALETPFQAIATVINGGIVRRDVIKTIPYSNDFKEIDISIESANDVIEQARIKYENRKAA